MRVAKVQERRTRVVVAVDLRSSILVGGDEVVDEHLNLVVPVVVLQAVEQLSRGGRKLGEFT